GKSTRDLRSAVFSLPCLWWLRDVHTREYLIIILTGFSREPGLTGSTAPARPLMKRNLPFRRRSRIIPSRYLQGIRNRRLLQATRSIISICPPEKRWLS